MDEIIHHSTDESVSGVKVDREVSAIFQWSRSEIVKVTSIAHGMKQKIIKETALKLEEKIPIDTIAMEIVIQLQGLVSSRLIHKCLDKKYKQKHRSENAKK
jgi:hypothetical protein